MSDAIQTAILAAFSAALERAISQAVATHVQDLQTRLDALADRIDTAGGLADRMAKLEREAAEAATAVGSVLGAELRVVKTRLAELETKLTEANLFTQVTQAAPTTDITQHIIDALGDIKHPLFKRLSSFMDAVAEQAVDNHCETYDHDDYDSHVGDDDKHFDGDIEDAVRDALSNMSFDVTIR